MKRGRKISRMAGILFLCCILFATCIFFLKWKRQQKETISGTYSFEDVIYMNPLSSYYPFEDTGYHYDISESSLKIVQKDNEKVVYQGETDEKWNTITEATWDAFFVLGTDQLPEFSDFRDKKMLCLPDQYYLFMMDNELWVCRYGSEESGMWSIFQVKLK